MKNKLREDLARPFGGLLKISLDELEKVVKEFTLEFHAWMMLNDTAQNAEKWVGYTDKDMLESFIEERNFYAQIENEVHSNRNNLNK